jgi:predicted ATP-grasp superfamily ATP-dependent carboligase
MLMAFLQDVARIPDVQVATLLHPACDVGLPVAECQCVRSSEEDRDFRTVAQASDYTVVIAPELDDLLATRCQWVVESGGNLLGPSPAAVRLTADKLMLGRYLHKCGVPTPACQSYADGAALESIYFPAVLKPRFGAGSLATFLVRNHTELTACTAIAKAELPAAETILQPLVPGLPASVAFLVGPRQMIPLLPAAQHLSTDGRYRYLGGGLPLPPELAGRAVTMAHRAVAAISDLRGYVGVDLVLGADLGGGNDYVIEINPRLTTSYVGLRALAETNLAAAMLRVMEGRELQGLEWRSGSVAFTADGSVVRQS